MGRSVDDVDELVDATQIAERLRVSGRQVVTRWSSRYDDFPAPVLKRGHATLWYWPEIHAWARATGRLPGLTD